MTASNKLNLDRELNNEAWRMGILEWKLRPYQIDLYNAIRNPNSWMVVFNVSRRYGKSRVLVTCANEDAIVHPGIAIVYACAVQKDLIRFILPAFQAVIEDAPRDCKPTYVKSERKWYYPNGSTIELAGLDHNPNAMRGVGVRKVYLDECAFVRNLEDIYQSVLVPATMDMPDLMVVAASTPPESPEDFWWELVRRAQDRNSFIQKTIDDIVGLDPVERKRVLDEVGGEHSTRARREFFVECVIEETRAIAPEFKEPLHVAEFERPQYAEYIVAGDIGGSVDRSHFLLGCFDWTTGKVLILDERTHGPDIPPENLIADALTLEAGIKKQPMRLIDARGMLNSAFASLGYAASSPTYDANSFQAGLMLLRSTLHTQGVLIHPRCAKLLQTLKGGLLNRSRMDFERTLSLGHADAIAALILLLRYVDRVTNPQPPPSHQTHFIPPPKPHTLTKLGWQGQR